MNRLVERLLALSRWRKRLVLLVYDFFALSLSLWLSFCIRLGTLYWPREPRVLFLLIAVVATGLAALVFLGVHRAIIRYLDTQAASRIALGAFASASAWFMLAFLSRIEGLPRSVGFIYFGLSFILMFFGRLLAVQSLSETPHLIRPDQERSAAKGSIGIAIHGANPVGCSVVHSLRGQSQYRVKFFVDENPAFKGRTMMGLPVHSPVELREAIEAGQVQQLLLAMPPSTRAERMAAVSNLSGLSIEVLTVPSYEEIMSGRYTFSDLRPVRVDDLLQRDVVPPRNDLIEQGVEDKVVLITGAGGSIGSEICRQVSRYGPRRMVLLDHSEFALFSIETELRRARQVTRHLFPYELVPVVGSLLNARLIESVLERYQVDTVFHAAAYKHVPLLETNEVVGVENNVIGTKLLADACVAAGVSRLTMISTDKAVRPTNVMGSSKRAAELYIQALANEPDVPTCFGIVRFGNVLDSSGSVVQEFRRQIEAGGPITVTHPDITRFFMSIPEATQLVLQANALATGGEVFVLDMGEPVRIAEFARTMISLSGMTERTADRPAGDIEIKYVGLRPGEKLYEELFIGECVVETSHPQIKMARERLLPLREITRFIDDLRQALARHDPAAVRTLLGSLLEAEHRLASLPGKDLFGDETACDAPPDLSGTPAGVTDRRTPTDRDDPSLLGRGIDTNRPLPGF